MGWIVLAVAFVLLLPIWKFLVYWFDKRNARLEYKRLTSLPIGYTEYTDKNTRVMIVERIDENERLIREWVNVIWVNSRYNEKGGIDKSFPARWVEPHKVVPLTIQQRINEKRSCELSSHFAGRTEYDNGGSPPPSIRPTKVHRNGEHGDRRGEQSSLKKFELYF